MQTGSLRNIARSLFETGVRAADAGAAVTRALAARPLPDLGPGRHLIFAIGKAAGAMAEAALAQHPKGAGVTAIVVTNRENAREIPGCTVIAAGHPTPDEQGLRAGQLVIETLKKTGASDHVLCLISGGGSALLPAPIAGVSLQDKARTNDILLAHGFDITEINLVRQNLSRLKGGGLAKLAAPAKIRTLVVSDVIGDSPSTIASGPTATPLGTAIEAAQLLRSRGVWDDLPQSVRKALQNPPASEKTAPEPADIEVICSNRHSLAAIAQAAQDWSPKILSDQLCGDVSHAARQILAAAKDCPPGQKQLLIWGGETTVNLTGNGLGGRNQEIALRVAAGAENFSAPWVFLSGGTDGRDGPCDAAGGLVDEGTTARLSKAGRDLSSDLANNDSYHALKASGDLLKTGPTGTNVADIQLFLKA